MITIKSLKWSNWFSYGDNNYIDFDQPVLQIMGKNGSGKTSIPLILQEVFYGKNSKGKKKAALPNRYITKPALRAEAIFKDATDEYKISLTRLSSLKLHLYKNGKDISSHTTTATYKTIQEIIGLDFKTFSQLIYQSSTDNLEFLTATDANRKKFLISLFALDNYISIHEQFKKVSSEINIELTALRSKISTIKSWVTSNETLDFTEREIKEIPEIDDEDITRLGDLRSSLKNISETNKKINSNNQLKELLETLDTSILYENIEKSGFNKAKLIAEGKEHKDNLISMQTSLKHLNSTKSKINSLGDKCPSCEQVIAASTKSTMLTNVQEEEESIMETCIDLESKISIIHDELNILQRIQVKLDEKEKVSNELTRLSTSIDNTLDEYVLDEKELKAEIEEISTNITKIRTDITNITSKNKAATAHNSKIEVVLNQLEGHRKEIEELLKSSEELANIINRIEIIKKAFSPSGLLSYKIDFLVKDLEKEINEYLSILSSGKFQLLFKLENEKLNIEIIDEGMSVGIEELSAGELARINAATLLAIRKLMAAISSTKINILFLDEIMGVLDDSGKEMLIEVLHAEKDLNTLLVSHEYSHPLIPKITIVKEKKVSRIDKDG